MTTYQQKKVSEHEKLRSYAVFGFVPIPVNASYGMKPMNSEYSQNASY